jgi:hypothetical protein
LDGVGERTLQNGYSASHLFYLNTDVPPTDVPEHSDTE